MDLEKIVQQQSEQISQLTQLLIAQQKTATQGGFSMHEGGSEEMGTRKLKYGQGSITKRIRVTYFDQNNKRKIITTSDENKAMLIQSKIKKYNVFEWYEVRWLDEYGRRHTETAKTKVLALTIIDENNKRTLKNSRKHLISFGQAMRDWYKAFREENACDERNQTNMREIDRLPKSIHDKPLQAVTAQELQSHLNNIENDTPRVTAKTMLCSFLRYMFLQNLIKKDIGVLLKAPKPRAAEKQVLTIQDEPKFLELMPEKFRKYVIGLIYTGCRYSEFISIQAEDVDRVNKTIKIRETKSLRAHERKRGITHNTRVIPLLPQVEAIDFPLPYISQAYFQQKFQDVSKQMGIKVSPHDMRHTFATRCDDLGVKEKVIQGILGHKNERMTRHYKDHKTKELLESEYAKMMNVTDKKVIILNHPMLAYDMGYENILTLEEEAKFIKSFPESWRNHITTMIYTGCTYREITSIQEKDIDRKTNTIFIRKLEKGRDARPARTIPLLPPVEQIKFPLEKRSPKYFINCFHQASERLGKKILAKDLPNVFQTRLKEHSISKSTPISTPIQPENDLKNDKNEDF